MDLRWCFLFVNWFYVESLVLTVRRSGSLVNCRHAAGHYALLTLFGLTSKCISWMFNPSGSLWGLGKCGIFQDCVGYTHIRNVSSAHRLGSVNMTKECRSIPPLEIVGPCRTACVRGAGAGCTSLFLPRALFSLRTLGNSCICVSGFSFLDFIWDL